MKIGIFDSGLGGLFIAQAVRKLMPEYNYVYLGDTKRVPYGNRSHEEVFKFTKQAVNYLLTNEDCAIVIIACNTASARALRRVQKDGDFKNKKVLGVLIPAAEAVSASKRVGVLGTKGTVASNSFPKEIKKLNPSIKVIQNPAPMLVPLIEEGNANLADKFIIKYLKPLLAKKIDTLVLGCTHYPILKTKFKKYVGKNVKIISQDEVVPKKFKNYLKKHREIENKLTKSKKIKILTTDQNLNMNLLVKRWFGENIKPKLINL